MLSRSGVKRFCALSLVVSLLIGKQVLGGEKADALKNKNVLVIIVSGTSPQPGSYYYNQGRRADLQSVKQFWERLGYDAMISSSSPNGSVSSSVQTIRNEVLGSSKHVLLVGHSLGGTKILELLSESGDVNGKLVGAILVTTPIRGSIAVEETISFSQPERQLVEVWEEVVDTTRAIQQACLNFWDPFQLRRLNPFWVACEDGWYVTSKVSKLVWKEVMRTRTMMLFQYLMGDDLSRVLPDLSRSYRRRWLSNYESSLRSLKVPIVNVIGSGGDNSSEIGRVLSRYGRHDGLLLTAEQEFITGTHIESHWWGINHLDMVRSPNLFASEWRTCEQTIVSLSHTTGD